MLPFQVKKQNLSSLEHHSTTESSLKLVCWTLVSVRDHGTLRSIVYWATLELGHLHSLHCLALQPTLAASGFLCTPWQRPAGTTEVSSSGGTITGKVCGHRKWMVIIQWSCSALGMALLKHFQWPWVSGSSKQKRNKQKNPTKIRTFQHQISQCNYSFSAHLSLLLNWAIYPPCKRH